MDDDATRDVDEVEREYQKTLTEISTDASLAKFRGEYEKLHLELTKSLQSEKSLTKKCRALNAEVVDTASKVQTALRLGEDDQATIDGLRGEITQAWKLVDATKEKEKRTSANIESMRLEIETLTEKAHGGDAAVSSLVTTKDGEINLLMSTNTALTTERDAQVTSIVALRDEVAEFGAKLRNAEAEKLGVETRLAAVIDEKQHLESEAEREHRKKARLETEIVELKLSLETAAHDVKQKTQSLKDGEEHVLKLTRALDEQREQSRRARKSHDVLDDKAAKVETELKEMLRKNDTLEQEIEQARAEVRERTQETERAQQETNRVNKVREGALASLKRAEQSRTDAEKGLLDTKRQISDLERDAEAARKQGESDRKARESLKREMDVLAKQKALAENATQTQVGLVRVNENSKKNLEVEIAGYKAEAAKQAKALYGLEMQREKFASDASGAHGKLLSSLEEMKLLELGNVDLLAQIADGEVKLKTQQNLYEGVRADRNVYSKNLVAAQDEISEMRRKFKIMNQQVEQLKEEIGAKDIALVKEHFDHMKVEKEKEGLRFDLAKAAQATRDCEKVVAAAKSEVGNLERVVSSLSHEKELLRKEHDVVTADRDVLGTQLVKRNDELALLYEKIKIQQTVLNNGQRQYRERLDELRVLKIKLGDGRRELDVLQDSFGNVNVLKREVHHLGREILKERTKVKALSEELENPLNVHRWRALEGSDPGSFELITKIGHLQKRLIAKTEQAAEKDLLLTQKQALYDELKHVLMRQPGPEVQTQLGVYQNTVREKNKQLKSLAAELNLYRGRSDESQLRIERLTSELNMLKKNYYEQRRHMRSSSFDDEPPAVEAGAHQAGAQKRFAGGGFGFA